MSSLIPWRRSRELEWPPFRRLADFEDLFSDLFQKPVFEPFRAAPALESFVRNGNLIIRSDLPGLDPKEIDISVLGNVLTIKGERKSKEEAKEDDYIRHEISYGSFERQMTLPEGVEADKMKATYDKGVLEISMPTPKGMTLKKVQLKVEAKS